jgi:carbonic anhydrase
MSRTAVCSNAAHRSRRALLTSALSIAAAGALGRFVEAQTPDAGALTKEQRDKLTPDQVIAMLKSGNERFRAGNTLAHNYLAQKRQTAGGQYPAAAILSCIDSRAPAEILFDAGIGDAFNSRIAGNVANDDVLGSLEFACAAAGAKLILVMGHTACGAVKGAIDGVQLGHLTGLLEKIRPAVAATTYSGDRTTKNGDFVDAVARTHVQRTVDAIRSESSVLARLLEEGKIKVVGSMYHLQGGRVEFLS